MERIPTLKLYIAVDIIMILFIFFTIISTPISIWSFVLVLLGVSVVVFMSNEVHELRSLQERERKEKY